MARVLIVDDSHAQIYSLKKLIEEWGHETLSAESGDQALQIARQEQPNVILMDIVMPGMNGFQTARILSRDQTTHSIPVIFVSNRDGEADRVWGMRQGATAYITKPVKPEQLWLAISAAVTV